MKAKNIVMLGGGPLQVPAIQELKKLGAYVRCFDFNPRAEGFRYADEAKIISTQDVEAICGELKKQKADVLMTSTSDAPVRVISEVSEKLGIPCELSYEDACAVTIKSVMRERLRNNGVPIPKFVVINDFSELKKVFVNTFDGACIIKPADNAGSRGVKLLQGHYKTEELEKEYNICKECAKNGIIVAEEIMNGPEVSVESMTIDGETVILTITDKVVCERPYFVEIGHVEPSRLPEDIKEKIEFVTRQAITAMNIKNAPTHTEIIVTKEGPKIVEIAARLGGDFITSRLVPLSTGINMVRESVKLALGEDVCLDKTRNSGAAIRFLCATATGTISKIEGVQDALAEEGICEVVLYAEPGEKVSRVKSSNDRIGHIIAIGQNAGEAWNHAKKACQKIRIILDT